MSTPHQQLQNCQNRHHLLGFYSSAAGSAEPLLGNYMYIRCQHVHNINVANIHIILKTWGDPGIGKLQESDH